MRQDQFINIDTPENVVFDYEVSGIGSRFLAAMIDSTLIVIGMVIVNFTGLLLTTLLGFGEMTVGPSVILAILGLFSFLVFWGYYIFFEIVWNGQSPGKRWLRLRVLRIDGTPIGAREAAIRNLVRIVDFLPVFYGVGLVAMFANRRDRRLGDFAAGTLVVHEESAVTLADLEIAAGELRRTGQDWGDETEAVLLLPVEKLSGEDLQLVEDYLQRRTELRNRAYLSGQIARSLYEKMELPPESIRGVDAEQILVQILLTSRQRIDTRQG
ncbi:MAG: RDD family protein [Chloroflexota bacterium]|jgi:uncharacterized RDD family membrane protein YckC